MITEMFIQTSVILKSSMNKGKPKSNPSGDTPTEIICILQKILCVNQIPVDQNQHRLFLF